MVNLDTLEALDAGAEVDPGRAAGARPRGQAGPGQDPRPGRAHQGAHRARRTASRQRAVRRDRGRRRARPRSSRRRGVTGVRRPEGTRSPTGRLTLPHVPTSTGGRSPMSGLSRLRNMFRVPDLRNKILFTIFIIAVYRLGSHIPVPYVDFDAIKELQDQANNGGVVGFLDLFSGGAITNVADLLPRDHAVHHGVDHHAAARRRDPEARAVAERGPDRAEEDHAVDPLPHRRPRARCSRPGSCSRCTRARAACSGFAGFQGQDLIPHFDAGRAALIVLTWTAGTALVMWLGELITQRGIGNGMSILIFASVVSRLPAQGGAICTEGRQVPVRRDHRHRASRMIVGDRVRRVGAATNPRAVRETCRRPPHVRRPEHLHPAEGQPVGCDPGDLRELDPVVPARSLAHGAAVERRPRPGSTTTW